MSFEGLYSYRTYPAVAVTDFIELAATPTVHNNAWMTIQPDKGAFLRLNIRNSTVSDFIKIYVEDFQLYLAQQGDNRKSDEVLYNGKWYTIIEDQGYDESQPIPHHKYIAVKLQPNLGN